MVLRKDEMADRNKKEDEVVTVKKRKVGESKCTFLLVLPAL